MKIARQITKEEWKALGGRGNPKLFRTVVRGKITYWRTE